jgi:hypothetical protein
MQGRRGRGKKMITRICLGSFPIVLAMGRFEPYS